MRMKKWLVQLAVLFGSVGFLGAAVPSASWLVKFQVNGLACPFCAYGLEKRLKETGAERVTIYVDKGLIEAVYPEKRALDVDGLKEAVKKGGFTPGAIEVRARGSLIEKDGRWVFELAGSGEMLLLKEDENLKKLLQEANRNSLIRLSGKVEEVREEGHGEHHLILVILSHETLR